MEERLIKLFDANDIFANERLNAMIADTLSRYSDVGNSSERVELSEDETVVVAAAGVPYIDSGKVKKSMSWKMEE